MRRLSAVLVALLLAAGSAAAPWFAAAETAVQAVSKGLNGAPNFRDLGGYATRDGKHVVRGLVFRSDKLSELTPADVARVKALGIRNVVDLRTVEERHREPDAWRAPAVYESPKPSLSATLGLRDPDATPDAAHARMVALYARMPADYAEEYAAMFHRLAAGGAPLIVHCTAGKDRTGVASALLLTALGVPRETVVSDYLLTNARRAAHPPRVLAVSVSGAQPEVRKALMAADPDYINSALDALERQYGSIDSYMRQALGLTDQEIASLRRRLTR